MTTRSETQLAAWVLLSISQTANVYGQMGSNLAQIRTSSQTREQCEIHRLSYKPAASIALLQAAALSAIAGSPLPLLACATTISVLINIYEHQMPAEYRKQPISALLGRSSLKTDSAQLGLSRPYQSVVSPFLPVQRLPGPPPMNPRVSIQFAAQTKSELF